MAASIEEFKGMVAAKGGLARSNLFVVTFPSLPGASSRDVNLLCKDVQLPGRQITTQDRQIGVKSVKLPYGFLTEDISLTFHVMNDWGIKSYFESWQALAVNPVTYEINYKQSYVRPVTITAMKKGWSLPVFNKPLGIPKLPSEFQNRLPKIGPIDLAQGEIDIDLGTSDQKLYEVKLINAFCTTMNQINLNNEANGLVELNIQLSYDNWESTNYGVTSSFGDTLGAAAIGGLLPRLF